MCPANRRSKKMNKSYSICESSQMRAHILRWSCSTILTCSQLLLLLISPTDALANCPNSCQCDDDTLMVKCGEGVLDVLPIALNPSIQRLVIKNNKIKTIDSSIQFYAELTYLDLSFNDLVNIPPKTFAYQRKLQELHLNHNKIGQINNKTFTGLSSLIVLNLRGNLLADLEEDTFTPLGKIVELNLGENRISHVHPKSFGDMSNLRVLYLDDNTLTQVPSDTVFQAMPTLAELYLGTNSFTTILNGAFENLTELTRLDLHGAGLQNLLVDALRGLENVRYLDLTDNRLQHVPTAALQQLTRLEELRLGQNDFEVLGEGAFAGLTKLRRLEVLGAPRLRLVKQNAFAANANLEYLDLSANKLLKEVQENAFNGLPHLRHIILKGNQIGTLKPGGFEWDELHTLDLTGNPFFCDCHLLWLHNLLANKNASQYFRVYCALPVALKEQSLGDLATSLLGCSQSDVKQQAMIGVLLMACAATITALALIIYSCRKRIRDALKGSWDNAALGRKEREYQKTCSDEEYMTRQQPTCIHPSAPYPVGNYSQINYIGTRPIPVTEL